MNKRRILGALAMAMVMAIAAVADAQPRRRGRRAPAPLPPAVAQHVTILDGASGALLLCQDCETAMPPASMSKLMTVLIVAEALKERRITMETRFRVSENAWRHGAQSDGSHMFLEINSDVSVRDLLQGAIIVSANDACVALAEGVAGSEAAFVERMNQRAQALGLRSARFRNATGLPDPEHLISAADLARLARILITQHPELYRFYAQPSFTYNNHAQENRNPLLGAFEGADGVKTGHTSASGYGMVGSAVVNGQRRIIVFSGLRSLAQRREEALRLMRSAFADYSVTRVAARGAKVGEADVYLGARRTVALTTQRDIVIGGARAGQTGLSARIVYQGPLHAPVRQGDVVAQLVIEGPGIQRQQYPLVAAEAVGRTNWFSQAWTGLRLTLFGG